MQYVPRTQNSGIEGGPIDQSSTLRKLTCEKAEGTCLKSHGWLAEQTACTWFPAQSYFHSTSLLISITCLEDQTFHL